jgi:hypothetical protein
MKITVCYLINADDISSIYSFECANYQVKEREQEFENTEIEYYKTLGGEEVDILVGVYPNVSRRVVDFFRDKAKEIIEIPLEYTPAQAYNILFRKCFNSFVCVLPTDVFLKPNWLSELSFFSENVDNCGFAGVPHTVLNCTYSPVITKEFEGFLNVFLPANMTIKTDVPFLFNTKLLFTLGGLTEDTTMHGYEFYHYQLRAIYSGLVNFYISSTASVVIPKRQVNDDNAKKIAEQNVQLMRKQKDFYIAL